jgi:hypothetical protein
MASGANGDPMGVNLSTSSDELLHRIWELGALEGPVGDQVVSHEVQPAVDMLLHILAGGEVNHQVIRKGAEDTVAELKALLEKVMAEINTSHKGRGHCVIPA